ncbi:hypothetical protein [Catenulispora subtropica]|uniref:hypothetical protein n=1 Tax=Catenulispora subtropica TaxID=450798 RepID=UPI0031E1E30A
MPNPADAAMRVAQFDELGGLMAWTPGGGIRVPDLVVYGDGTVVAGARRTATLSPDAYADLVSTARTGLKGLPQDPPSKLVITDGSSATLGVRFADGTFGTVRVNNGFLGADTGYPGRLLTAYRALKGLRLPETRPYTPASVVVGYGCSSTCSTTETLNGSAAAVARASCKPAYEDPQQGGTRTCIWRYALPDELTSPAR